MDMTTWKLWNRLCVLKRRRRRRRRRRIMVWTGTVLHIVVLSWCLQVSHCIGDVKPSFVQVPSESLTVPLNSSVTLKCEAAGSPTPNITWTKWKNSTDIPTSWVVSPGTIQTQRFRSDDVGQYTCTAVNSLGFVSHTTNIAIQNETVFVRPDKTTVRSGSPVDLECHAPSTAQTVTWITPSSGNFTSADVVIARGKIMVDGNHTLHIVRTDTRHHGLYTCVIADGVSSLRLDAQVNVESSPVITHPPISRQVLAGERVTYSCKADGYPPPTIEWFRDLKNGSLENVMKYSIAEGMIEIPNVSQEDVGIFRCIAKNTVGSTVAIATLNVIITPFFYTSLQDSVVHVGDDVTLLCEARGSPVPVQRWERYGKTMIIDDNMQLFPNFTIVISNLRKSQLGEYTCTAKNIGGRNSTTLMLRKGDVDFTIQPENSTVILSKDIILNCQATSENHSKPEISWKKTSPEGNTEIVITNKRVFITGLGNLIIKKSKLTDEGWYVCSAKNEEGKISSEEIFLDVQFAAHIFETTGPQQAPAGSFVTLHCNTTGDPDPEFVWTSPGGAVIGTDHTGYQADHVGFLNIASVSVETDAGDWKCEACNPIGCDSSSISLLVEGAPNIRSVETTRNSTVVTIKCVAVGLPVPRIAYLNRGRQLSVGAEGHSVVGGVLYIKVTALSDWYTCTANNQHGATEQQLRKPKQPTKPLAIKINSRNITLTWNSKSSAIFPSEVIVQYRQYDSTAETNWILARTVGREGNTTVLHLAPYIRYVFRVREKNVLGEGPVSETSAMYRTLAAAPSAPDNVDVQVHGKTLNVTWLPSRNLNGNIGDILYDIQLLNSSGGLLSSREILAGHQLIVIFDISKDGKYAVVLSAFNMAIIKRSEVIKHVVDVANPVPDFLPQILKLSAVGAHKIAITWTVPVKKSLYPAIDGYVVYSRRADRDAVFYKTIVRNGSTASAVVAGLEERARYSLRVAAFNTAGTGPVSDVKQTTTHYEQFSLAAYSSAWHISGWEAAIIAGCLAALCAIICLIIIIIQHIRMKKRHSVSFVKPSQALSRFYLQNPNVAYYSDRLARGDGASGYDNLAFGDGLNDDYVRFIKGKWNCDVRLETLSNKNGSAVRYTHVNPAFNENDNTDNQEELLSDFDTEIHQPRRENSITADSGVTYDLPSSISDGDLDGNFILLPKLDEEDRPHPKRDREHSTQEVKIDFPDDTSLSSSVSYGSSTRRPTNDIDHFFNPL